MKEKILLNALIIRVLVVDDEQGAVNTLSNMLREYCPQVKVVGSALTVNAAVEAIKNLKPDMVFLDIEMPPLGNGFDVLAQVENINFGVVFTTAYMQYAVRAINTVQPWAYLVKPYSVSELTGAVDKAGDIMWGQKKSAIASAGKQTVVLHRVNKQTLIVRAEEVVHCEADGGLTQVLLYTEGNWQTIMVNNNIGHLEMSLPELLFNRVHHSHIVNYSYIEKIDFTGRNAMLNLKSATIQVPASVSRMNAFQERYDYYTSIMSKES
jgi:two-component system, LytTR family, response regulator